MNHSLGPPPWMFYEVQSLHSFLLKENLAHLRALHFDTYDKNVFITFTHIYGFAKIRLLKFMDYYNLKHLSQWKFHPKHGRSSNNS